MNQVVLPSSETFWLPESAVLKICVSIKIKKKCEDLIDLFLNAKLT